MIFAVTRTIACTFPTSWFVHENGTTCINNIYIANEFGITRTTAESTVQPQAVVKNPKAKATATIKHGLKKLPGNRKAMRW